MANDKVETQKDRDEARLMLRLRKVAAKITKRGEKARDRFWAKSRAERDANHPKKRRDAGWEALIRSQFYLHGNTPDEAVEKALEAPNA